MNTHARGLICTGGECAATCPIFNLGNNLGGACLTPAEFLADYMSSGLLAS